MAPRVGLLEAQERLTKDHRDPLSSQECVFMSNYPRGATWETYLKRKEWYYVNKEHFEKKLRFLHLWFHKTFNNIRLSSMFCFYV